MEYGAVAGPFSLIFMEYIAVAGPFCLIFTEYVSACWKRQVFLMFSLYLVNRLHLSSTVVQQLKFY